MNSNTANIMTTINNHPTPHAPEVEKGVLGLCICEPERIHYCVKLGVQEEYFLPPIYKNLWSFIKDRAAQNLPFDMASFGQAATDANILDRQNGASILAELISKASPAAVLAEHIKILNAKYTRREIIKSAAKATALACDEGTDGSEIEAKEVLLTDIYRLKREEKSMRTATTLADTLNHEVWPSINERNEKHTHILGVRTGFPSVDDALGGLRGGTVTILGARPSTGKTALSLNMGRSIAEDIKKNRPGAKLVYLTAEMTPKALAERMLTSCAGVDINQAVTQPDGGVTQEQADRLNRGKKYLATLPVEFHSVAGMNTADMAALIRQEHLHSDSPVACVVLDYLQLIQGDKAKKFANRNEEIGEVSRGLHQIATELNIPMLVLSQLNRNAADKAPTMADLRESGSIEQDADAIVLLHRPAPDKEKSEKNPALPNAFLNIVKNRDGKTADVNLSWTPEYQLFTECNSNDDEADD